MEGIGGCGSASAVDWTVLGGVAAKGILQKSCARKREEVAAWSSGGSSANAVRPETIRTDHVWGHCLHPHADRLCVNMRLQAPIHKIDHDP